MSLLDLIDLCCPTFLLAPGYKLRCLFVIASLFLGSLLLFGLHLLGAKCPFPSIVSIGIGGPLLGKMLGEMWIASLVLDKLSSAREFVRGSVLSEHWTVVC